MSYNHKMHLSPPSSPTLVSGLLLCQDIRFHMKVIDGFDDVDANQGQTAKVPLVKDADVEGRGIQLLLGQVLGEHMQDKATKFSTMRHSDNTIRPRDVVTPQSDHETW